MKRHLPTPDQFFRMAVAFEGGLVLAGLTLGWLMTPPAWEAARWSAEAVTLGALWSLPPLVALVFLRQLRGGAVGRLNQTVDELLVPLFTELKLWQFVLISALAGIGEELLFRGILQQLLADWTGAIAAVAMTSLVFGLAHLITPLYGVLAALVSVYLGWLFIQYENLAVPMITHAMYDFVALAYLVRPGNDVCRNRNDKRSPNDE
ncbi:MAG: CPBP family intramembrane glutamic endopeptidase [Pirellulales bacterium]